MSERLDGDIGTNGCEQTCRYYNHVMGHWGEVPVSAPGWVCEEIVRHHLECPSLLCILSFQDWLSIDEEIRYTDVNAERINVPANPRHYWRYRMHLTLEELMNNKKFNEKMVEIIDTTIFSYVNGRKHSAPTVINIIKYHEKNSRFRFLEAMEY